MTKREGGREGEAKGGERRERGRERRRISVNGL